MPLRYTLYDDIISEAADKYRLDPLLIKAVILAESDFNAADKSQSGALGLMQLMPETALLFGVRDLTDPEQNIMAGCRFLRDMLVLFKNDLIKALAAYNAGPNIVKRYGRIPPFKETKDYIKKVFKNYDYFRANSEDSQLLFENIPV